MPHKAIRETSRCSRWTMQWVVSIDIHLYIDGFSNADHHGVGDRFEIQVLGK